MNIISDVDLKIIKKISFENVDFVFDALSSAFHPDGVHEDEGPDAKFYALWTLFLASAGWTEAEYWEEFENKPHICPECEKMSSESN